MNMNITEPNHDLGHGPFSIYLFEFSDGSTYTGQCGGKPEERWRKSYNEALTEKIEKDGGIDKVNKTILRTGLNKREAAAFETYYACRYHSFTNGYNIRPTGRSNALLQISKDFEPLNVWDSATQVERVLGIPHGNVIAAAKGKNRHSAGGFYWCWASALWLPEHLQRLMEKAAQKAEQSAAEHSANAEGKDAGLDKTSTSC